MPLQKNLMVNEWCLNGSVNGKWYFNGVPMVDSVSWMVFQWWCMMVNGVSMVESVSWMVFQWWRRYGEWCFYGGVCMVNGVSMVELYGEWCANGGFEVNGVSDGGLCMVNGVSMVASVWRFNDCVLCNETGVWCACGCVRVCIKLYYTILCRRFSSN